MLSDDVYIGGESDCNIFTLRRNAGEHIHGAFRVISSMCNCSSHLLVGDFHLRKISDRFVSYVLTILIRPHDINPG